MRRSTTPGRARHGARRYGHRRVHGQPVWIMRVDPDRLLAFCLPGTSANALRLWEVPSRFSYAAALRGFAVICGAIGVRGAAGFRGAS
jgi:hypothetical protein